MANTSTTVALQQNNIPPQLLLFMLFQFMLIIAERIIYLYHSIKAKIVLQIALCLFLQIVVFVILPQTTALPFSDNKIIIAWYFVTSVYLLISAYQIRYAYPKCILRQSLTKSYSQWNDKIFAVYSAIPFIYEIRTSLDWACTDTTLDLISWFKVSECARRRQSIHRMMYSCSLRTSAISCSRSRRTMSTLRTWRGLLGCGSRPR